MISTLFWVQSEEKSYFADSSIESRALNDYIKFSLFWWMFILENS